MNGKPGYNQVVPARQQESVHDSERQQGISMLARVVLGAVVVVALIISVTSVMKYNELETRKAELAAQVDACKEDIAELQYLINAPMDEEYVARVARERLHLYYPDEEIYYSNVNSH